MQELITHEVDILQKSPFVDKEYLKRLQKEYAGFALARKLIEYENYIIDLETKRMDEEIVAKYDLSEMDDSMLNNFKE